MSAKRRRGRPKGSRILYCGSCGERFQHVGGLIKCEFCKERDKEVRVSKPVPDHSPNTPANNRKVVNLMRVS